MTTRDPLDRYYTPEGLALQLTREVRRRFFSKTGQKFPTTILEPSAGGGAFVRASRIVFPTSRIVSWDIDPEATSDKAAKHHTGDWLNAPPALDVQLVIGNPPYKHAQEFVERSIFEVSEYGGVVAYLLRLAFLESRKRKPFFDKHPPAHVIVLSERPSFTTNGKTDGCAYGFFIWDSAHDAKKEGTMSWL